AGDNKAGTNNSHEGRVVDSSVDDAGRLMDYEQMIKADNAGQHNAKLVVVTLPVMLRNQWTETDREQQDSERQHDWPVRGHCGNPHKPNHSAIGLIASIFVNETRKLERLA